MAYSYKTDIQELARQVQVGVAPALKDLIKKRLMEEAEKIVEQTACEIADKLTARVESAQDFNTGNIQVLISINGVKLEREQE